MTEKKKLHTVAVKLTNDEIAKVKAEMGCCGAGTAVGIIVRQWLKERS